MTPIAQHLVTMPIDAAHNAGPTFEVYEFGGDPWTGAVDLAQTVASAWRNLAPVEATLRAMVTADWRVGWSGVGDRT